MSLYLWFSTFLIIIFPKKPFQPFFSLITPTKT